jgi:hypothetical protein
MRMKPKENKGYNTGTYDECQTPPYALEPLYPYLDPYEPIWECAAGKRVLSNELIRKGYGIIATDINDGVLGGSDFFEIWYGNTLITNPPYSLKYEWLERCYDLGFPFALLMPVEMLGTAKGQRLFDKYGIEVIFMSPRVDFLMPHALWAGHGAQFPTAWFTWKLNLPKEMNYAKITKPSRKDLPTYWKEVLGKEEYVNTVEHAIKERMKYRKMSREEVLEYLALAQNYASER